MIRNRDSLSDEQILEILHLYEVEGMRAELIGRRFSKSKSAILGIMFRVRADTDASDNGHGNGTMPPRWWKRRAA